MGSYQAELSALLNFSSAVFMILGILAIKRKNIAKHQKYLFIAIGMSSLFLINYVIYHLTADPVKFQGEGWIRTVYFSILISHIILAFLVVPLVLITTITGLRKDFGFHKKIGRWTVPIWLYVSITGVLVYFMLYQI